MKKLRWSSLIIVLFTLSACETMPKFEGVMTNLGGIAGGVIGTQVDNKYLRAFTTVLGAYLGAEIGKRFGQYLDEQDQERLENQITHQMEEPEPQITVSCTGEKTRGFAVVSSEQSVSCDREQNKMIVKTSQLKKRENGHSCRQLSVKVETPDHPETWDKRMCVDADGNVVET
jgi:surface antigen